MRKKRYKQRVKHLIMESGKKSPVNKRSRALNKIAAIMRSRFNELVELEILDTGKSLRQLKVKFLRRLKILNFMQGPSLDIVVQ